MRKLKTCRGAVYHFVTSHCRGRVAAAPRLSPRARMQHLLRFYDFEPPNGPYGVGSLLSDPPKKDQGPAFDAEPPTKRWHCVSLSEYD